MFDPDDLASPPQGEDLLELIEMLKNGLTDHATGGKMDPEDYLRLRKVLIGHPTLGPKTPRFLRICSSLTQYWNWIKGEADNYAKRRTLLNEAFRPLLSEVEGDDAAFEELYVKADEPLGRGGFGLVYRYHHRHLDMDFAFKLFAPSFSDGDKGHLERFFREARILFRLHHPDIIRIYDVGMMRRRPFIRMEFFEGQTLLAAIRQGHFDPQRAVKLVARLAAALDHAHGVGVIHRDIKPANVMVNGTDDDEVRLIDFGIGVLVEEELISRITRTGHAVAGGHYTAPELVENPKLIDPRTDIYSLGALWHEMIVGRPPAAAGVERTLSGVSGLPEEYKLVLLRCLSDVTNRFSTMRELLVQLSHLLQSTSIVAR